MTTDTITMDIHDILKRLPHRYPILLVDRVVELVKGERIRAIKNVSINEPFFLGHFPHRPVMPGVLIVEAMAQTGGVLVLSGQSLREGWRKLVSPVVVTLFVAVAVNLGGLTEQLPVFLTSVVHSLAVCAIPLGLIMTGVNLAQYLHDPAELFDRRISLAAMALRMGVLPVGILALAYFLPLSVELKRVLLVQAAMPAAVIPIIISRLYGGHPRTAVQIVLGTTALGILVIPLWLRAGLAWLNVAP